MEKKKKQQQNSRTSLPPQAHTTRIVLDNTHLCRRHAAHGHLLTLQHCPGLSRCLHNRWSAPGPLPGSRLFTLRREEWCKSHLSHLWLLLEPDELKVSVTARTSAMLRNLVFFSSLVCNYYQLHYTYFHGEKYPLTLEDSLLYFGLNWVIFQQNTEKSCLGELENHNKSLLFFLA